MAALKLALLGSPHVTVGEQSIVVESRKALALLFYLAITNQRQGRDWLATLFWPEQDQSRARASLRQVLWLLRGAGLEPWLVVDQDALALQGEYWCDVHDFHAAISAGQIDEALTLYRADLLAGFSLRDCPEFDQWHFLQADELRRRLAGALEQRVLRCGEEGEYEQGLKYARRWLALDPLHEPAHRTLMRLYAYAGQFAAALRQYDECVRLLEEELGVSPEDETTELYQAIKSRQIAPPVKARPEMHSEMSAEISAEAQPAQAPDELPATDPVPVQTLPQIAPASYHNLPLHITTFVGREAEIGALVKIVADPESRLVTIIGPGGMGKTRLAVQVARRFVESTTEGATPQPSLAHLFPQGVIFVALHAVESTGGIIAAIAEAGGFVFYNNEPTHQQLLEYLHERKVLLLLDNFEHLLDSVDFLVDFLLHAPHITILVTSREALNLQGEWLWNLGGLDVPDTAVAEDRLWEYSAVRMFVQSARRIQPNFSLSAEHPHVVRICQLVGGMPLAIELAVAWLRIIPCAQIAGEIERDVDFLTTRLRDVPERHRSIHAVFEHSWRLLSSSEQETFQQLSVFRGDFDYKAAAQVAGAAWLDLAALRDKSLLNVNPNGRYTLHPLLRQYGAGKLTENPAQKEAVFDRFCAYFVSFLHQRQATLFGPGQLQAAAEVAAELHNVRAAWQWALQEKRLEAIRDSASAIYFFCQLQSRFLEGAEALEDAQRCLETLQPSEPRDLVLAHILCHLGWLYIRLGELVEATTVLQRSRQLYANRDVHTQYLVSGDPGVPLAMVHHIQGDFEHALELAGEALRLTDSAGLAMKATEKAGSLSAHHHLAFTHYVLTATNLALGHHEKAQYHMEAASTSARAAGNRWFLPYILNESGKVSRAMGNYAQAKALFQESFAIKSEFNDPEGMAVALNHLGEIAYLQSDYEKAQRFYTDAFEIYGEINDQGGLAVSAKGLGQVACAKEEWQAAKHWFEQSLKVAMEMRFWPLIYALLLEVGHLFMQTNAQALAVEAVALVQKQPASDFETKERARQRLQQWQSQVPAECFDAAVQLGSAGDAEALLPRILTELSVAS